MFKQICFFRKRPDMTLEQFMDYYESQHSQLAKKKGLQSSLPNAQRYVRRYITQELNPVTCEKHDPGYDCIMEIWWNSREDFENARAILQHPDRLPHTIADEKNLFATHSNPVCSVVESDSPAREAKVPIETLVLDDPEDAPRLREEHKLFKQVCFFKARPGMTQQGMMDYYENQHSQLIKKNNLPSSRPNAHRYVRRYLTPELNPVTLERLDPGYDCLMEIWWNNREDFEASRAIIQDPERLPHTKADEAQFFSTHDNPVCSVVEYDSAMGRNGEATTVVVQHG